MELGTIRQINIDGEMQASYLDYAMSVIVARALPDVRDGLKPVHRRILYAMHDLGLHPTNPTRRAPVSSVRCWASTTRTATRPCTRRWCAWPRISPCATCWWTARATSAPSTATAPAAMRYTEARLAKIATEMLGDIEKDTVALDGQFRWHAQGADWCCPPRSPNLLVNGASGIAVGMATNIPPHNLGEVCDALCYMIDRYDRHDDATVEDLMQFIPGPDFPTGGVIYRYQREGSGEAAEQVDVIAHAYAGGKGHIVMQAKAHIEEMSRNRARIVVTELPYMTNKTNLLERIAELVRDGRLDGITDLRDESDRTGMRIVHRDDAHRRAARGAGEPVQADAAPADLRRLAAGAG